MTENNTPHNIIKQEIVFSVLFPLATENIIKEKTSLKSRMKKTTYDSVIKNFVCFTDPSVETVPFETSNPKSFNAFICFDMNKQNSIISNTYKMI